MIRVGLIDDFPVVALQFLAIKVFDGVAGITCCPAGCLAVGNGRLLLQLRPRIGGNFCGKVCRFLGRGCGCGPVAEGVRVVCECWIRGKGFFEGFAGGAIGAGC